MQQPAQGNREQAEPIGDQKEEGLPWFAHDSPGALTGRQSATGSSGEVGDGGASSTYLTLLGLRRSRFTSHRAP
jgi:hypothetical protein